MEYQDQRSHPVYELKVNVSNASRLFEYYALKPFINSGSDVLDIGCNSGVGMDIIKSFGCKVYGIDVIPKLKSLLEEKYKDDNDIFFEIVSEGKLGFKGKKFDYIIANNFIEHVPNPDYYLNKFLEKLKLGGKLFLTTVNRNLRLFPWQKPFNQHHFTEYSPKQLKRLVKKHFNKIELKGIIKSPPFFIDYKKDALRRKIDLGIKLPFKLFLKRIKSIFFKRNEPEKQEKIIENSKEKYKLEKFILEDFKNAFDCIEIDNGKKLKHWSEIFVIATK